MRIATLNGIDAWDGYGVCQEVDSIHWCVFKMHNNRYDDNTTPNKSY